MRWHTTQEAASGRRACGVHCDALRAHCTHLGAAHLQGEPGAGAEQCHQVAHHPVGCLRQAGVRGVHCHKLRAHCTHGMGHSRRG